MSAETVTWADAHPDAAEAFAREPIPWPCEPIDTGLGPVVQPCLAMGPGDELFVSGYRGHVLNSRDGGRTWFLLCVAPPLAPPLPPGCELAYHDVPGGVTIGGCEVGGIGATREGTLLLVWTTSFRARGEADDPEETSRVAYVTRSEDHGKTWEAGSPIDPSPARTVGANQGNVSQLADGRVLVQLIAPSVTGTTSAWTQALYVSGDDGRTWVRLSQLGQAAEPHILETEPGRMLAALRYQRDKTADDPADLATAYDRDVWMDFAHGQGEWAEPTDAGVRIYQHTALATSGDGGLTWSTPRIVTGLLQQSASLLQLSDRALVLTFGRPGQRFMLSYDEGETWSRAVYQLHHTGEYARSAALVFS